MATLNRKSFLKEAAIAALSDKQEVPEIPYVDPSNKTLPRSLQKTSSGIGPYTGVWGETQVYHLLRRTLFGVTKSDIDFFKTKTMNEAVNLLLTVPTTAPSPPLNHYSNNANQADAEVPYGQTWVNAAVNFNIEGSRIASFKAWWMGLIVNQEKNIREKMTLFWHNLLATETSVFNDSRYIYKHHALLRANALGNYKDLVKQVTIDPFMLRYLNGYLNTKTAPDENFARELQELFTVGKDLAVHYTEEDVKQAARVLTGWRDNRTGISSFFDNTKHDTGNKTFSSFYNNTVITGRTGTAGANELDDLLNMIFAVEEVSKYIVRKLYRYFVYYIIDENVEAQVIVPLAQVFRTNNYNIKPVLETLFKSEHFYDTLNMGCMIKPPVEHIAGTARLFNLVYPDGSNVQQLYTHWLFTQQYATLIGQDLGDPPNVAGWPAYWQEPQYYEMWINSDSLPKRNQFCDYLLYVGYPRQSFTLKFNTIAFAQQFSNPSNPNTLISDITKLIFPVDISQTSKDSIKVSFLLSGQSSDHYWTDVWNTYIANPNDINNKSMVESRLQGLMKHLLGLAEYQLS